MMIHELILIHSVCMSFPQEWPALLSAVEYLYFHDVKGSGGGFSAWDLSNGHAVADVESHEKRLLPFQIPDGLPETKHVAGLFKNFKELAVLFRRLSQEEALRQQVRINQNRHNRELTPGSVVFRLLPKAARLPKGTFPEKSTGPYLVKSQISAVAALLTDLQGNLINGGNPVPLDQILEGPIRTPLQFPDGDEVRGLGAMLRGDNAPIKTMDQGQRVERTVGKQKGWANLYRGQMVAYAATPAHEQRKELTVGAVLTNLREERHVVVRPYRGIWEGVEGR